MEAGEIQGRLGATLPVGGESVTLFIPEKDRDGQLIDQARWVEETLGVFGKLFRGATAFPPSLFRVYSGSSETRKGPLLVSSNKNSPRSSSRHTPRPANSYTTSGAKLDRARLG